MRILLVLEFRASVISHWRPESLVASFLVGLKTKITQNSHNFIPSQISLRKVWIFKCVRSSRLLLPPQNFHFVSNSKFDEKGLEIEMRPKFSLAFLSTNWATSKCERKFFLFQNFTVLDAGCSFSFRIFKFVLEFSMMELPVDEDPACSRVPRFRDFPLAAGESGCEFSCRPENENNSKFAQFYSKSNFVEESLDFQMCQKFSPPSSSTKLSLCF